MTFFVLLAPILALFQTALPQSQNPGFEARLFAAETAVQPGEEADLAVELRFGADWHIFHPLILDTGLPTSVDFELPPGVAVGELRFPTPMYAKAEVEGAKQEYLELTSPVVVLTKLRVSPEVKPGPLTIKAHVRALACKVNCVPVNSDATLTLPVSPDKPAPANEKLFEQARRALPQALGEADYVAGSRLVASHTRVPVGGRAAAVGAIRVKAGHHVQDRDPGVEGLVASRLFIEHAAGFKFADQVWPQARVKNVPDYGKVREQSGEFIIQAPFELADEKLAPGPVRLRVLFEYQTCADAGTCFAPNMAEGFIEFEVTAADVAAVANPDPVLAKAALATLPAAPEGGAVAKAPAERPPAGITGADVLKVDFGRRDRAEDPPKLWMILILGFLGGLLLNVMPCVFPVISIKIISFINQAGEDRGRILRLGLAFCAGIMVWFWVFAVLTGIGHIPWQHPPVMIMLTAVIFVFALNLFGVFEINLPGSAVGTIEAVASREGYTGAFMKGFLATLLGTACTAPFFGFAAANAATQPRLISALIFTSAGLGMSTPYVLLAAFPGWLRLLPRPGPWMVTFKQFMGFVLIGTAAWLLLTIADLLDARGVVWTVSFLSFLALSAWLIGRIQLTWTNSRRLATWAAAIAIGLVGYWFCFSVMYDWSEAKSSAAENVSFNDVDSVVSAVRTADWSQGVPWQRWRKGLSEDLARRGYTVFVDFTATWCPTCQTNKPSMEIASTRDKMRALGVIPLKADYTKENPEIRALLLNFGVNSVPLNLIYPAGRPQNVTDLPTVLTPGILQSALDQAGPSRPQP